MSQFESSHVQKKLMKIICEVVENGRLPDDDELNYIQENIVHMDFSTDAASRLLSAFVDELLRPLDALSDSQVWKEMLFGFAV